MAVYAVYKGGRWVGTLKCAKMLRSNEQVGRPEFYDEDDHLMFILVNPELYKVREVEQGATFKAGVELWRPPRRE